MTAAVVRLDQTHRHPGDRRWRPTGTDSPRPMPSGNCGRQLRVVPPPRPSDRHPAVLARRRRQRVRRRRVLLAGVSGIALVALALPWGGAGGHPLATPGPVLAGAALRPGSTYVVQPGDTIWSIAERLDPNGDPRAIVTRLEAAVGSDVLQPGERIHLP